MYNIQNLKPSESSPDILHIRSLLSSLHFISLQAKLLYLNIQTTFKWGNYEHTGNEKQTATNNVRMCFTTYLYYLILN